MKTMKFLTAGLLALAVAGSALADTTLKITGSTAYRKALYAGVVDTLSANGTVNVAWYGNAALTSANQVIFMAGTSPNKVTIQCCMAGSVGGVNWVANALDVATDKDRVGTATAWLDSTNTTNTVTVNTSTGALTVTGSGVLTSPVWAAAAPAGITMSDSFQDSTQFNSTDYTALNEQGSAIGIVEFVFAKGKEYVNVTAANSTAYGRFTNMTALGFRTLASSGYAPLALFTGNSADANIDVVLVGRDSDSGTRLGTFYETAYGTDQTAATQYRAYDGAGGTGNDVGTVTGAGAIKSLAQALNSGDSAGSANYAGYSSGGNVKAVLNANGDATSGVLSPRGRPAILVGYLGTGDLVSAGGQILSYNGVALYTPGTTTQVPALTEYGQYTFWTEEHMYWNGLTGLVGTVNTQKYLAKSIADKIRATYATTAAGLLESSMFASRAGEGTPVVSTLP